MAHAVARRSGSSPLSRGILIDEVRFPVVAGIIPALAGNTCAEADNALLSWDHPRSRGEYFLKPLLKVLHVGSSPLSRGILTVKGKNIDWPGIIPALAGNTGHHPATC